MRLLAGVLAIALPAPAPIAPEYVAPGGSYASGVGAGPCVDGSFRFVACRRLLRQHNAGQAVHSQVLTSSAEVAAGIRLGFEAVPV